MGPGTYITTNAEWRLKGQHKASQEFYKLSERQANTVGVKGRGARGDRETSGCLDGVTRAAARADEILGSWHHRCGEHGSS